ncbi:MAG: serine protease [Halieaceae bacterium]
MAVRRCLLLFLLLTPGLAFSDAQPRAAFDKHSPQNLRAVGKLIVPGHRLVAGERLAHQQDCSASLIGPSTILTAWHCLEYYRDLSRDPQFTLANLPGQPAISAYRLADGGGMQADWALLRLHSPVRGVPPLPVSAAGTIDTGEGLLLAGYAADEAIGRGGEVLSWQAHCLLTEPRPGQLASDCVTYKGASGGPVMTAQGIVGVISSGDGSSSTYFVPSTRFLSAVRLYRR